MNWDSKPPTTTKSLLSTYFSTSQDELGKAKLDFTHKSFQEYLLAEFYVESIFNAKYHRLIGNEPSRVTYRFLNNFVKLLTDEDPRIKKYSENFIKSFYRDDGRIVETELDDFIKIIRRNSTEFVKLNDIVPDIPRNESVVWNYTRLEYSDLRKLWAPKWITLYLAGNLAKENDPVDGDFLSAASFYISNASSFITNKELSSVTLQGIIIKAVDLSNTNFSNANLAGADFTSANLNDVDFTNANLTGTHLSECSMIGLH